MKTLYTLILLVTIPVLVSVTGNAQTAGDYRSKQSGNWNDPNTWETYNGSAWVAIQPYAYPNVAGTNTSTQAASTTHNVNLPAGIVSGDLLLVFWADYNTNNGNFSPNPPAGWTQLYNGVNGNRRYAAFYRIANGTEGATASFTTSTNEVAAQTSYRISAGSYTGVPVAGTPATGTTTAMGGTQPLPPTLTSTFGNVNTFWIVASHSGGSNTTTYPSDYTANQLSANTGNSNTTHAKIATAARQLQAASVTPTNRFGVGNSINWATNTIAIRGVAVVGAIPSNINGAITIRNGHTVTVTAAITADQVTVDAGGTLVQNANVTIANGAAANDFVVNGYYKRTAGTITTTGALAFNANSTYEHAMDAGTIPVATWDATSTTLITGQVNSTTDIDIPYNASFGNLTINNAGQTDAVGVILSGGATSLTVKGNLTVLSTGGNNPANTPYPHDYDFTLGIASVTVNGNFIINGGNYSMSGGPSAKTLTVNGDLIMTGGYFIPSLLTNTGNQTITIKGDANISGGVIDLDISNTNTTGNIALNIGGDFSLTGASKIQRSSTKATTATITFNGTTAQTITGGGTLTGKVDFVMNNANSEAITLATPFTLPNNLTLTKGIVHTSSLNVLTISSATATVTGANDNSFVAGPIRVVRNAGSSFIFPTGKEGAGFIPIQISNISTNGTYEAELKPASSISQGLPGAPLTWVDYCQYWTLKAISPASATANVTMSWNSHSACGPQYITQVATLEIGRHATPFGAGTYWTSSGGALVPGFTTTSGSITANGVALTSETEFTIASSETQSIPLPVKFGDIKAYSKNKGVQVDWTVYSEQDVVRYEIERSSDGVSFSYAGSVAAKKQDGKLYYGWFDASPLAGANYYRIKNVDIDGRFDYSTIVKVSLGKLSSGVSVYPNPVSGSHISLQASDVKKGDYKVEIFNTAGQKVYNKQFNHAGGNISQSIELPASLQTGVYHLQLTANGYKQAKSFLIQ